LLLPPTVLMRQSSQVTFHDVLTWLR